MTYPFDYYPEDDEDLYLDCALGPNGQCAKAGSEECDWECPNSHGPLYAGSKAWSKRHDAEAPIDGCECSECRELRRAKDGNR